MRGSVTARPGEGGEQKSWRHRLPQRPPLRVSGLVSQNLLNFPDLFLDLAFDLFRLAVGLEAVVADRLAGDFLDAAGDVLGGAFYFILGTWFHVLFFGWRRRMSLQENSGRRLAGGRCRVGLKPGATASGQHATRAIASIAGSILSVARGFARAAVPEKTSGVASVQKTNVLDFVNDPDERRIRPAQNLSLPLGQRSLDGHSGPQT